MNEDETANETLDDKPTDTYEVTFKNGALSKLKKVALDYGISEDDLDQALVKGVKLLELAKEFGDDNITIEGNGRKETINLKEI
jgi:hypothetical protein